MDSFYIHHLEENFRLVFLILFIIQFHTNYRKKKKSLNIIFVSLFHFLNLATCFVFYTFFIKPPPPPDGRPGEGNEL